MNRRKNRRERRHRAERLAARGPVLNGGGLFWWHQYGAVVVPDGSPEGEGVGASLIYGPTTYGPEDTLPNGEHVQDITPTSPEGVRGSYVTSYDHTPTEEEESAALTAWRAATEALAQQMNAALLGNLQHEQGRTDD